MTTVLLVLPDRTENAAANMATDLLLLEAATPGTIYYRHYGWSEPAFTFGVSQSRDRVRAVAGDGPVLVRRATGGGVVSHLDDWTYALIAPAGHVLAEAKASESYRAVHAVLADALRACGVPAELVPCPRESCAVNPAAEPAPVSKPGVCFVQPEIYDVVRGDDGRKIAGAAQKRTRDGILFQGSADRTACPEIADWGVFDEAFITRLALVCNADITPGKFPGFPENRQRELHAMFGSDEWNGKR